MNRFDRRLRVIAATSAAVAGFVDAIGFLETGGFFVSFMSGNSTRLSIYIARGLAEVGLVLSLIASFVLGVAASTAAARSHWFRRRIGMLYAAIAITLTIASLLSLIGHAWPAMWLTTAEMSALNVVFEAGGEVRVGLTYMTGTLVRIGQELALAPASLRWLPHLVHWLSLVAGAVAGAFAHAQIGSVALSLPALILLCIATRAHWLRSAPNP